MTSQPLITFPLPGEPPSAQQIGEDPDSALSWIKDRMNEILAATKVQREGERILDHRSYTSIYTVIYEYSRPGGRRHRQNGPPFGEQLYRALEELLRTHYDSFQTEVYIAGSDAADDDTAILTAYLKEWPRHLALVHLNCGLFGSVDRHWVKREIDERMSSNKPTDVCSIRSLHMRFWRLRVLCGDKPNDQPLIVPEEADGSVAQIVARLQQKINIAPDEDRNQEEVKLLEQVMETYKAMGLDECQTSSGQKAWKVSILV